MSSTKRLNICGIIARIKKYQLEIKKKKRKYGKVALLTKTDLDCIKGSISRSLTDSDIERDYFLLTDVLRAYNKIKIKNQ